MSSRHIPHPAFDNAANLDSTLLRAIRQYEQALMANDTATLSELFADNPDDIPVVRSDSAGMLVGHNAITAFRAKRGGPRSANCIAVWHDSWMPTMHA